MYTSAVGALYPVSANRLSSTSRFNGNSTVSNVVTGDRLKAMSWARHAIRTAVSVLRVLFTELASGQVQEDLFKAGRLCRQRLHVARGRSRSDDARCRFIALETN